MTITRSEVLRRAGLWPLGSVPYSQNTLRSDGYRQDCSGYVSMCWGIAPNGPGCWGGFNTATAISQGYMHEIDPDDLKPGDAIGLCGPGSEGDAGHIQLFLGWDNNVDSDNGHTVLEQTGGGSGPHRNHKANWRSRYKAYRYRDIVDDAPAPAPAPQPPASSGRPAPGPAVAFPLPSGYYFGPKEGPRESISCQYGETFGGRLARAWLQEWANQLARRGWPVGKGRQYLRQYGNDGYYGGEYMALAVAFQRDQGLKVDGLIGAQTWTAAYHNSVT